VELWQKLAQVVRAHEVEWRWVRGHDDNPKNEYADHLAVRAAEHQERSNGLLASGFDTWLAQQRARGKYGNYDPDEQVHERV
jgi:ribonuclease HI